MLILPYELFSRLVESTSIPKAKSVVVKPVPIDDDATTLKRKRGTDKDYYQYFPMKKKCLSQRENDEEEEWEPASSPPPGDMDISPEKLLSLSSPKKFRIIMMKPVIISNKSPQKSPKKSSKKSPKKASQKSPQKIPRRTLDLRVTDKGCIPIGPRWIPPSLPVPVPPIASSLTANSEGAPSSSISEAIPATPSLSTSAWVDDTFSSGPASITAPPQRNERLEARCWHLWARTRPELCETTPYFRSFQGGVHHDSKSGLMGYLL